MLLVAMCLTQITSVLVIDVHTILRSNHFKHCNIVIDAHIKVHMVHTIWPLK